MTYEQNYWGCRLMVRQLPPMHHLLAFEAAARCGSFTAAAGELGVTQGAVSQSVKALEQRVGRPLFRRHSRGNELTNDGRQLLEGVCDALERLGTALRSTAADRTLTVSVLPGFAVKWLFPRLIRFDQIHPEIEVSITTSAQLDFAKIVRATIADIGYVHSDMGFDAHTCAVLSALELRHLVQRSGGAHVDRRREH